jgi:hypothetical protein
MVLMGIFKPGSLLIPILMEKKGFSVSCSATPGWRLTGQNAKLLAEKVGGMGEEGVLVLYGLDSSCFVEMDESTLRCGPPRKGKGGRYHLKGKLTVITGMQLDSMLACLAVVLEACWSRQVIIVTPVPRFWLQCCLKHSQHQQHEDKERLLRKLGKFRRALMGLIMGMKVSKTVHLLNPLEVLNMAESSMDIESVMLDQVHLLSGCYDMIADEAGWIAEGWKAGKRFPVDTRLEPLAAARRGAATARRRAIIPAAMAAMPDPRNGKSGIPDKTEKRF